MPYTASQLNHLFAWREPSERQYQDIIAVRSAVRDAAKTIVGRSPPGPDQDLAVQQLRQGMQSALSAIMGSDETLAH